MIETRKKPTEAEILLYRQNPKEIVWSWVSSDFELSEDFIREFKDYVDWNNIFAYQKLSKEFIIEFAGKISFNDLMYNTHVSNDVKEFCRMFI